MPGPTFKQLKAGFFDRNVILKNLDRANERVQSKFGAFARRRMQTSLKYRTAASAPGAPPSVHRTGNFTRAKRPTKKGGAARRAVSPLRELIFFARDPATNSVVVGPLAFGARGARTLEQGGFARIKDKETGRVRTVFIRKRPFVKPAGDAEARNFPQLLRALVK